MIQTIIFDLGGVFVDWNPQYLYRKIFTDESEMHYFLENICTADWNEEQDGGRTIQEATDYLLAKHPEYADNIRAYYERWPEMLGGLISGTVDIFKELKAKKEYNFYALTNWSAETYPIAQEKYEFLSWFDGVVVSGTEKDRKPFASFYQTLLNRYNVNVSEAIFIDDNLRNVHAAEAVGIKTIHFTSPEALRAELNALGIL
ncbi:HAD family hydrolase [Adhaeribacter radiodurans]|uniref:HAD family phosphatase n=1 Tax=Adhaeribacter radiodurans TaxID=2745197 RepID=A0A7L7L4D1_9BACT|nr:HAD family phosphatase [Adhaeribacter radiodurans]QMU27624.1 HAD family phosphatase [Adhaeribacter radiodurans]